ncbi:MAG TPA: DNA topoisomerase IB, partial [Thermoanaerobaculia bacterium]|nr:DNA topoisomerase IB [Thermoanaerobaculia bacterium]
PEANRAVVEMVKKVAEGLGNRPAICRKYYIHPVVIEAFVAGKLEGALEDGENGLRKLEAQVLRLLRGNANGGEKVN